MNKLLYIRNALKEYSTSLRKGHVEVIGSHQGRSLTPRISRDATLYLLHYKMKEELLLSYSNNVFYGVCIYVLVFYGVCIYVLLYICVSVYTLVFASSYGFF